MLLKFPNKEEKEMEILILNQGFGQYLKQVNLSIPLGTLLVLVAFSGSGKSTLINETLYPILNQHLYRSPFNPLPYKNIKA